MDMKYIVLKKEDVIKHLNNLWQERLNQICFSISKARKLEGKGDNTYIVINTDEPYAPNVIDILKRYGHWGPETDELPKPTKPATIAALVHQAHQTAIDKGWYEEPRTFGEIIALVHSELSEALEDYRNGHQIREIYYEGDKPCGIPIELADVLIRIFDTCGYYGIDLEAAIREKMAYNSKRPQRHGGKLL